MDQNLSSLLLASRLWVDVDKKPTIWVSSGDKVIDDYWDQFLVMTEKEFGYTDVHWESKRRLKSR